MKKAKTELPVRRAVRLRRVWIGGAYARSWRRLPWLMRDRWLRLALYIEQHYEPKTERKQHVQRKTETADRG